MLSFITENIGTIAVLLVLAADTVFQTLDGQQTEIFLNTQRNFAAGIAQVAGAGLVQLFLADCKIGEKFAHDRLDGKQYLQRGAIGEIEPGGGLKIVIIGRYNGGQRFPAVKQAAQFGWSLHRESPSLKC